MKHKIPQPLLIAGLFFICLTELVSVQAVSISPSGIPYSETTAFIQNTLLAEGYDCGTADGFLGLVTKGAIKEYQRDHGMQATGLVTDELLLALQKDAYRQAIGGSIPLFLLAPVSDLQDEPAAEPDFPTLSTVRHEGAPRGTEFLDSPDDPDPDPDSVPWSSVLSFNGFDSSLYEGTWVALTDSGQARGYEVYLPSAWSLSAGYTQSDAMDISYDAYTDNPKISVPLMPLPLYAFSFTPGVPRVIRKGFIDAANLQLIPPGETAEQTMDHLKVSVSLYEQDVTDSTYVTACHVNGFEGFALYAKENAGQPYDYTVTCVGQNAAGEVLVAGFSANSHSAYIRRQIRNILASIHPVAASASSAPLRLPVPTQTPTPTPSPLPTPTPALLPVVPFFEEDASGDAGYEEDQYTEPYSIPSVPDFTSSVDMATVPADSFSSGD